MKKQFLGLVTLLLFFSALYSQNKKAIVSLSVGPSFPTGGFGDKNIAGNSSGLAKTGEALAISYNLLLGKKLGIAVDLAGQRNPLDISSIEKSFSQTKISQGFWTVSDPSQPIPPAATTIYPNWHFKKRSWLMGSLLVGGYGEFPFTEKETISFIPKLMAGVAYVSAPGISGSSVTDTAAAYVEQSGGNAFGFTYLLSSGLKYKVGKKIYLVANLIYQATNNMKFKDIKASVMTTKGVFGSPGYSVQRSEITGEGAQTISSLNLLIGIGLRL